MSTEQVLVVNAGSSSLRLALYRTGDGKPVEVDYVHYELGGREAVDALDGFLDQHPAGGVTLAVHRIVHGGPRIRAAMLLDAGVESELESLAPLAPLHNPRELRLIRACRERFGAALRQVVVPDTGLYAELPAVAAAYALPRDLCREHGIRRYGFHGIAHGAMLRRWQALAQSLEGGGRVISLQLGSGCSVTAFRAGQPQDTSMGFSPLEGLVMATRCGDVDPGLLIYLQRTAGLDATVLDDTLNHRSGLAGVSGISGDMRQLLESQAPAARLAVDLYCYRARKYIGAYLAALGGADAILFGGGVGEHSAEIRARIVDGLQWAGIELDAEANARATGGEAPIHANGSAVSTWVVPVDEAGVLVQAGLSVATD